MRQRSCASVPISLTLQHSARSVAVSGPQPRRLYIHPPATLSSPRKMAHGTAAAAPSSMERPHSLLLRLPPGFRFHPTDEELVVQYLRRRALARPLPASIIPDLDLASFSPWDLPAGGGSSEEEERYFFNLRTRCNRAAGCGYWRAAGKDRAVVSAAAVVGVKKVLVFYQGKPPNGRRTEWVMHEYRLASPESKTGCVFPGRNWVLCRVFKKKRNGAAERFSGFTSSVSSTSSCLTDFSGSEDEATSSSSNCSSP